MLSLGYLENINSDRKIIEQAGMRMDMLYFLGYEIDEPLPWHSTLSRTRKLFGEEVFLELFRNILRRCEEKGMLDGKTQSIDSAFIKANTSFKNNFIASGIPMATLFMASCHASTLEHPVRQAASPTGTNNLTGFCFSISIFSLQSK